MAIAMHHSQAKGATRLVIIGIANHDGDGGSWPSVATLAKYASVSERMVQKCIAQLVELGEITRHMQQGGTRFMADHNRPNLYEFKLVCPPNCDRTKNHKIVDNSAVGGEPQFTPRTTVHPGGEPQFVPPVNQSSPEPSFNQPFNSPSSFVSTSPEPFEVCWACGQPNELDRRGFCKKCVVSNLDTPMISCTDCGVARKRIRRGEQKFTCGGCKANQEYNEAHYQHEGN